MQFGVVSPNGDPELLACTQVRVILAHSFEVSTVVFFVAPMTLMCVLYTLMAARLRHQRRDAIGHSTTSLRHVAAKRRVIKMLGEEALPAWAHNLSVCPSLYLSTTFEGRTQIRNSRKVVFSPGHRFPQCRYDM